MITVARYLGPKRAQVKLFLDLLNVPNIELSDKLYFDFTPDLIGRTTGESIINFARQLVGDPIPPTEFECQQYNMWDANTPTFESAAKKWDQQSG